MKYINLLNFNLPEIIRGILLSESSTILPIATVTADKILAVRPKAPGSAYNIDANAADLPLVTLSLKIIVIIF